MKRILIVLISILLPVLSGCQISNPKEETVLATYEDAPTAQTEPSAPAESTAVPTTQAPSAEYIPQRDPAELILEQMTLEEKVGQLFLVACPEEDAAGAIEKYHFGGLILFANTVKGHSVDTLSQTLARYQQVSSVPLLIAVDEEGGTVCRISAEKAFRSRRFYSPGYLLEQGGLELLLEEEEEKCSLLKKIGINVNLAPVCDLATDPNAFMYARSMRLSPEETASTVQAVVSLMDEMGIGSVLKHFPGYGNNTDTHTAMALDERALEILEREDLLPFRAGFQAGADAVMVSHTVVSALDSQLPASLSETVHDYLRQNMGFEGVIITDDLKMAAITECFGDEEASVQAVLAGNDMLCLWEYEEQYSAVLRAAETGEIPMTKLDEAVLRILRWKLELGIL